jgi:hypothetical protein
LLKKCLPRFAGVIVLFFLGTSVERHLKGVYRADTPGNTCVEAENHDRSHDDTASKRYVLNCALGLFLF